ncbi:hypothetical protein PVAND_016562 [Polypedilum vanderplanki]|uniref:Gustatory receptor n=1 Tax=Polypedilum vanderplanki TaxID=319348 RepID=A0A9J6BGJ1_POLVA|nr:hypothetical protein PVAND_016562 [Polypedilum vanderplanki]
MIENIAKIDEKFLEIGCKIDYKKDRKNLTKIILKLILFVILILATAFYITNTALIKIDRIISIFQLESFTSSALIILQVLLTLYSIKKRFEIINSQISTKNLKKLAEIHLEITTLIENFNEIFEFVILLCTVVVLGWFCMFVFSIVMTELTYWKEIPIFMIFNIFINVIIIGTFVTIIYFAECAKNEGRKTIKLLYMELHKIEDQKLCSNIQNFIYQIVITKNEFSCRLFDLNWTFLFKFLTTVAMYFVILVQFESSFKKNI